MVVVILISHLMNTIRRVLVNLLDSMEILYCGSSALNRVVLNKDITDYLANQSHLIFLSVSYSSSYLVIPFQPNSYSFGWKLNSSGTLYQSIYTVIGDSKTTTTRYVYYYISGTYLDIVNSSTGVSYGNVLVAALPI